MNSINGFSKLSKSEKIDWLVSNSPVDGRVLSDFWHNDYGTQEKFEEFSENTISNFFLPYGD